MSTGRKNEKKKPRRKREGNATGRGNSIKNRNLNMKLAIVNCTQGVIYNHQRIIETER